MAVSLFWSSFLAIPRLHLLALAILFSSRCIPTMHTPFYMPGQQHQPCEYRPISRDQRTSYSRDQLMAIQPARLTKDLVDQLRSLEIGTGLPRKRYRRKSGKAVKLNRDHLKWMCFNVQSCRQVTTDISEMILDNNLDILMLTETWLYAEGPKPGSTLKAMKHMKVQ